MMRKTYSIRLIVISVIVLLIASPAIAGHNSEPLSYRELRYNNLFGQTSWWSCGPASIATLLHYYYGVKTSELDVIGLVVGLSTSDSFITTGIDLLLMKDIFNFYNVEAIGYRISIDSLSSYYDQGGLPLILYFTAPKKHYVVGIGKISNDQLLIADPSFGHLVVKLSALESQKGFSGIVLATIPQYESQLKSIKSMQSKMLDTYQLRYNRLASFSL